MRETWVECVIVSCSSHTVSRSRGTRHTGSSPYRLLASSVRISLWNGG
jgi:hypothetical protein